jgi:hypothetical protein
MRYAGQILTGIPHRCFAARGSDSRRASLGDRRGDSPNGLALATRPLMRGDWFVRVTAIVPGA